MNSVARNLFNLTFIFTIATIATSVTAAGRGDGACVISQEAPIYADANIAKPIGKWSKGICVAGVTRRLGGLAPDQPLFEELNGRLHVKFINNLSGRGRPASGWMNSADLSRFTYECDCQTKTDLDECTPFAVEGSSLTTFVYNACFKEAVAKNKAGTLKQDTAMPASAEKNGSKGSRSEKALRNEDVISLMKVGLDDALIISKIKTADATDFDLSTDGLVSLKTAKVSNAVIDVMMKRTSK